MDIVTRSLRSKASIYIHSGCWVLGARLPPPPPADSDAVFIPRSGVYRQRKNHDSARSMDLRYRRGNRDMATAGRLFVPPPRFSRSGDGRLANTTIIVMMMMTAAMIINGRPCYTTARSDWKTRIRSARYIFTTYKYDWAYYCLSNSTRARARAHTHIYIL